MYIYILIISINIHKPQLVIFELSVNLAIVWGPHLLPSFGQSSL